MRHMVYDGDSFYELDEECLKMKEEEERQKETIRQKKMKTGAEINRQKQEMSFRIRHRN